MSFLYEKQAKSGEPMPDGLTMPEQMYYQALALLSARYKFGAISAEDSVREKRLLEREYKNMLGKEKYISAAVTLWANIENASVAFAKDPTIENAYKMHEAVYGRVLAHREGDDER